VESENEIKIFGQKARARFTCKAYNKFVLCAINLAVSLAPKIFKSFPFSTSMHFHSNYPSLPLSLSHTLFLHFSQYILVNPFSLSNFGHLSFYLSLSLFICLYLFLSVFRSLFHPLLFPFFIYSTYLSSSLPLCLFLSPALLSVCLSSHLLLYVCLPSLYPPIYFCLYLFLTFFLSLCLFCL